MKRLDSADKEFLLLIFLVISSFSFAQKVDSSQFDTYYNTTLILLNNTRDSVGGIITLMQKNSNLSEVQQAKIHFIKTRVQNLYEIDPAHSEIYDPIIDSGKNLPLFVRATELIIQSRPNKGIPLLLEYIEMLKQYSDSSVYATIYLAEGYRKIGEFKKGIDIINDILNYNHISLYNEAFAYNRLAAIYAQCGTEMAKTKSDSVLKYSNRCIAISVANNFTEYLATSQNELAFLYRQQGKYQLALDFGTKAYDNFIEAEIIPQAMNTSINLANIYLKMDNPQQAAMVLHNALELADVNTYRTLFMRIYLSLASINRQMGNNSSAYDFLSIARQMQIDLNKIRIRAQIFEMSAKYETEKKEKENLKLRIENEIKELKLNTKNKTISFLIIGLLIIGVSSIVIFLQYYQKKRAYNSLVKRNLEIVHAEKEYGLITVTVDGTAINVQTESSIKNDSKEDTDELIDKLNAYMKNEKPYLFSDISLDDISLGLNTNRTYLSKLINTHFNKNFNDFINEFRIKTARQLLVDPDKKHISIEGIGQMAGFNARSTFFTCFKKYTGISPSYFRQSIK